MTADAERLAAIRADLNVRVPAIDLKDRDAARNLLEIARELLAERDALRARINAARWAYINTASRFEAAAKMNAALAGDQPEATPGPTGLDVLATDEEVAQFPGEYAKARTPEPPHLDPEPWVCTHCGKRSSVVWGLDREDREFDPRPADENGKAYSDKWEDYP